MLDSCISECKREKVQNHTLPPHDCLALCFIIKMYGNDISSSRQSGLN